MSPEPPLSFNSGRDIPTPIPTPLRGQLPAGCGSALTDAQADVLLRPAQLIVDAINGGRAI
jgi:hypothetical protein